MSSLQLDLVFDNSLLNLAVAAGPSLHASAKNLLSSNASSNTWRLLVTSLNRNLVNDGSLLTLFIDVARGAAGVASVTIVNATASDPDGNAVPITVNGSAITIVNPSGAPQRVLTSSVLNGASLQAGAVAPGEIITVMGSGIGPAAPVGLQLSPSGSVTTSAGDFQVLFDSVPAPLVYSSVNQINAVVPFTIGGQATTQLTVLNGAAELASVTLDVAPSTVGIFTLAATGVGQVLCANEDGGINGALNPALPGSAITIYASGAGQTYPAGITGAVSSESGSLIAIAGATIDGHPAEILYAGPAPGLIAGLIQINLRIPAAATPAAAAPLVVSIGDQNSQDGVTIAIGPLN